MRASTLAGDEYLVTVSAIALDIIPSPLNRCVYVAEHIVCPYLRKLTIVRCDDNNSLGHEYFSQQSAKPFVAYNPGPPSDEDEYRKAAATR
eukprot:Stramenopile-MAST_4_protein_6768